MSEKPPTVCPICKKTFSTPWALKKHVLRYHHDERNTLLANYVTKKRLGATCPTCGKHFPYEKHFKDHLKYEHQDLITQKRVAPKLCALCEYQDATRAGIISHYESIHDFTITSENMHFDSYEQFDSWRHEVAKVTGVMFVKRNGLGISKTKKKIYFNCECSGPFRSKSKGIRLLKRQGSKKINGYCPAEVYITFMDDGSIKACWTLTHVGHDTKPADESLMLYREKLRVESELMITDPVLEESLISPKVEENTVNSAPLIIKIITHDDFLKMNKCKIKKDLMEVVDDIQTLEEAKVVKEIVGRIRPAITELRSMADKNAVNWDMDNGVSWYIEQ